MTAILRTPAAGPAVWRGADFLGKDDWAYVLTPDETDEILAAVARWRRDGLAVERLTRADAELPLLAPKLRRLREDLVSGRGFAVLRGLPVQRMSVDEAALAYWAVGTHIGEGVSQSAAGELLGHVFNRGEDLSGYRRNRGYQSSAKLSMHCDYGDVVGLLCYRAARAGGDSFLTSASTIYNIILAEHPEYLEVLYRGYYWTRNDEQDPDEAPHSGERIPTFTYHGGQLSSRWSPEYMEMGTRMVAGEMTPLETEVVKYIGELAWREDLTFKQTMLPGDAQFLNNYTVVHSRNSFDDWPEPERRRLLLRLWLRVPGIREFGPQERLMRDLPLIYGNQGRSPAELVRRGVSQP